MENPIDLNQLRFRYDIIAIMKEEEIFVSLSDSFMGYDGDFIFITKNEKDEYNVYYGKYREADYLDDFMLYFGVPTIAGRRIIPSNIPLEKQKSFAEKYVSLKTFTKEELMQKIPLIASKKDSLKLKYAASQLKRWFPFEKNKYLSSVTLQELLVKLNIF